MVGAWPAIDAHLWYDVGVRSIVASVVVVVTASAGLGACSPCRRIETTRLELDCAANVDFSGEIHLDTAGSYRSFLSDRCLTEADDAAIDALVDDVDFTTQAVFVARGARQGFSRCIEDRQADTVDVCDDGLRIVFRDDESGDPTCAGDWTVAFVLSREELRAAIKDDDAAEFDEF